MTKVNNRHVYLYNSMNKLIGLLLLVCAVRSTVLGIDFGTDYYKISVISRTKAFDMVENLNSKTNTYNVMAF